MNVRCRIADELGTLVARRDASVVVRLTGRLMADRSVAVRRLIVEELDALPSNGRALIDMSRVTELDAAGLTGVTAPVNAHRRRGGTLTLLPPAAGQARCFAETAGVPPIGLDNEPVHERTSRGPRRVTGATQHYAWGDRTFIPDLLGIEPDGRPWAELWLGTHPNGPTLLDDGTPLQTLCGDLRFILKVLAAAEPLSLQVHPDERQAEHGFRRGIYPDANAKPELLVALTPFEALCGIRPVGATLALLDELDIPTFAEPLASDGPGRLLTRLYRGELDVRPAIDACRRSVRPEARWVTRLDAMHPGDPSVAVTLLLNLVTLEPGQALRLDAGQLHAYLGGAGMELMGASDNVVRGGLTVKPVDVDELLRIIDMTPLREPVLAAAHRYELPQARVALLHLAEGETHTAAGDELAIDLRGNTWYLASGECLRTTTDTYVVVTS